MAKRRKKKAVDPDETKRQKFIRVVTPRVKKALKFIRLIGNQSGAAYEYNDEDVAGIMTALRQEINAVEKRYTEKGIADIDFTLE